MSGRGSEMRRDSQGSHRSRGSRGERSDRSRRQSPRKASDSPGSVRLRAVHHKAGDDRWTYDENFVLNRRSEKVEEYLLHMTQFVIGGSVAVPGMVRLDARTLFLSMTKKALDMFMSKHNQVRWMDGWMGTHRCCCLSTPRLIMDIICRHLLLLRC